MQVYLDTWGSALITVFAMTVIFRDGVCLAPSGRTRLVEGFTNAYMTCSWCKPAALLGTTRIFIHRIICSGNRRQYVDATTWHVAL